MANLDYVGAPATSAANLATVNYVNALTAGNMSQASVDALLSSGFSSYVHKSYVDTQDALNATPAFVDSGDAARLHLSQIGANNGVVGLDSTGHVEASRLNVASLQRWPTPFISPSAYHSSPVTALGETQLFTVSVADPGYTYKLLVSGVFDATTSVDGEYPVVRVRQGSTTGQLVGQGRGLGEWYLGGGTLTTYTTSGAHTYTVPGGFTNFDVVVLGGGGGGTPFNAGGHAGAFASASLVLGSSLPGTTATLTATVGAGGAESTAGGASSVTGTGVTTITGAGGATGGSGSTTGLSAGTVTLHGQSYVGGAGGAPNTVGTAPGGGGGNTKAGATGEIWILASNSSSIAGGQITVLPWSLGLQTALTGATTLYVMAATSGSNNVIVSTLRPTLMTIPVPA